jgi:hypothetical protein
MPLEKAPVENPDLLLNSLSLKAERHKADAHETRDASIFIASDKSDQGIYASSANGSDDPEFGEMRPDRDGLSGRRSWRPYCCFCFGKRLKVEAHD